MAMIESETVMRPFAGIGMPGPQMLAEAARAAVLRKVPLARILHAEYGVERENLLAALRNHYQCASIEYDERLPIPPELLAGLPGSRLAQSGWFPVIKDADGTVVIAACDPSDAAMRSEVEEFFGPAPFEFRVALPDAIAWFIQDFLHDKPGLLIGTERTGLAFWRNTMAQWRTRLACYRTDLARARTALTFVRTGLALAAISRTFLSSERFVVHSFLAYGVLGVGLFLFFGALPTYLRVRRSRMTPPRHQTLVEVSGATLSFLENYQDLEQTEGEKKTKETMLARLGDLLGNYCTILYPSPASRERTHLARERNVLAAQRTIAGCYRTIYSRARTGLAFIRTGVSFVSLGIGLIGYFGLGFKSFFDAMLIVIGLLMIIDGGLWYLPVRKEQAELPRTRSAVLAG
ncbi:MAG: GspE/PulE/PilB domain-containing protein [Desulfurivibrionaceae bacterium]